MLSIIFKFLKFIVLSALTAQINHLGLYIYIWYGYTVDRFLNPFVIPSQFDVLFAPRCFLRTQSWTTASWNGHRPLQQLAYVRSTKQCITDHMCAVPHPFRYTIYKGCTQHPNAHNAQIPLGLIENLHVPHRKKRDLHTHHRSTILRMHFRNPIVHGVLWVFCFRLPVADYRTWFGYFFCICRFYASLLNNEHNEHHMRIDVISKYCLATWMANITALSENWWRLSEWSIWLVSIVFGWIIGTDLTCLSRIFMYIFSSFVVSGWFVFEARATYIWVLIVIKICTTFKIKLSLIHTFNRFYLYNYFWDLNTEINLTLYAQDFRTLHECILFICSTKGFVGGTKPYSRIYRKRKYIW